MVLETRRVSQRTPVRKAPQKGLEKADGPKELQVSKGAQLGNRAVWTRRNVFVWNRRPGWPVLFSSTVVVVVAGGPGLPLVLIDLTLWKRLNTLSTEYLISGNKHDPWKEHVTTYHHTLGEYDF